jgi:hypothetical protein
MQAKQVSIMKRIIGSSSHFTVRVIFLWLLIIASAAAEMRLKQIHVITRHGSRYALTKTQTLVEGTEAGTLTPLGQLQMYDLGEWLRSFYASFSIFDVYDPSQVHLTSSALERTITSANSLALGLFPRSARDPAGESLLLPLDNNIIPPNVPVYTTDMKNDVTVRAYDKCDTFHNHLIGELYVSPEWQALEKDNVALLERLAGIPAFEAYADGRSGKLPLSEVWNAFDAIHVAKTECDPAQASSASCQDLQALFLQDVLEEDEWVALQSLAHKAELFKYGSDIAGTLVGGNLLRQIVDRMQETQDGGGRFASADFEKLYLYSAHYPTILGLFAALKEESVDSEVIPNYASALIFELYEDDLDGQRVFQILYKAGDESDHKVVGLDSICSDADTVMCPLTALSSLVSDISLEKWCRKCGNRNADVCLADLVESRESSCSSDLEIPVAVGWFAGILCSLVILAVTLVVQKRKCRSVKSSTTAEEDIKSSMSLAEEDTAVSSLGRTIA